LQLTDSVQADRNYCKAAMVEVGAGKGQQAAIHNEDVEAGDYSCCKVVVVVVEQAHHMSPQCHNQREAVVADCHYYYTLGMLER
jgi:hypothetical protein